ncbi:MAG: peptidylprolyl isomerase [Alteromonadaceae bacterium]|nr:peptidylprolyl isomerase [Alteromonadaceae bacterium]
MSIAAHRVVTLHYVLSDVLSDVSRDDASDVTGGSTEKRAQQNVLDDSAERGQPLEYLHGHENIVPGLERALEGQPEDAELSVTLMPAEAYGLREEALVREVGRSAFGSAELSPGDRFQTEGEAGPQIVTVLSVGADQVTVDTNHPLAGRTLRYDVRILGVREATRAELAKGHPLAPEVDASTVEDRKVL